MIANDCLQAVIECLNDCKCGLYASNILLNASEFPESSSCLHAAAIAAVFRALRDCDVTWKPQICIALARMLRWPVPVGSGAAISAIARLVIQHYSLEESMESGDDLGATPQSAALLTALLPVSANAAGKGSRRPCRILFDFYVCFR
jgi:hypothetical protein